MLNFAKLSQFFYVNQKMFGLKVRFGKKFYADPVSNWCFVIHNIKEKSAKMHEITKKKKKTRQRLKGKC